MDKDILEISDDGGLHAEGIVTHRTNYCDLQKNKYLPECQQPFDAAGL